MGATTTAGPADRLLPPLVLRGLVVDPPVVLAPMAGITDPAFRRLVAGFGGGLFVSEMVLARGLVEDDARTWSYVRHHPDEPVRSVQLYGSDPATLGLAVRRLVEERGVEHVDLNLGCPVRKITRAGGGAALPVKRPLLRAVVRAAVAAAGDVPVTVKMRTGLDDERLTYLDAGRIAAEEGVASVALHARTVVQGYAGDADRDAIARLRDALPAEVPVLGNGDVWTADDAVSMVRETGCDGVVVGRGCLGRPWLFADLEAAFTGGVGQGPPSFGDLAPVVRRHLDLLLTDARADARNGGPESATEHAVVRRFRKHLRWYLEGYPLPEGLHARAGGVSDTADVDAVLAAVDPDARVPAEALRRPRGKTSAAGTVTLPHGWWEDRDADVTVPDPTGLVSGG
jgi:nifR3 family TIM-barrel protein